jgi:hypothetical protein
VTRSPDSLFLTGFTTKMLYTFLISPMCVTSPTHCTLLDLVNCTLESSVFC